MAWYKSVKRSCRSMGQVVCVKILSLLGIIFPGHVAVIMDGNRRYARRDNADTIAGHRKGFDQLLNIVKWSTFLGVRELTVYAFSIENFKRSEQEVSALMDLAAEKFQAILDNTIELYSWGVTVRIVGRSTLLPAKLQTLSAKLACAIKNQPRPRLRLNIAFPYTGRDEISRGASCLVAGVANGDLAPEDIDEDLISRTLDLGTPDLMIRTSGEVRLSDFMLWQVSSTVLYFTNVLWPEFKIWHLLAAFIYYLKYTASLPHRIVSHNKRKQRFLEKLHQAKWHEVERLAAC